jgi:hypothetical protein
VKVKLVIIGDLSAKDVIYKKILSDMHFILDSLPRGLTLLDVLSFLGVL